MKRLIIIIVVIIALIAIAFVGMRMYTKSFSPQETVTYDKAGINMSLTYSRPFKNDRVIFGDLVPYGEVWRTGANEAAVFRTNAPLQINGEALPAGEYSVFVRPEQESWDIIFNSETGQWGISPLNGQANRSSENDVLVITVPSITTSEVFEQFTITFDDMNEEIELIIMWDQTMAVVPIVVMPD